VSPQPASGAPSPETDAPKPGPPRAETASPPHFSGAPSLFPSGHRLSGYHLPLTPRDAKYVYEKNIACPVCEHTFKAYALRSSRLVAERTEYDLRVRYKGVEPLYYDVVTCPKCWYSALADVFQHTGRRVRQAELDALMLPHKAEIGLNFGLIEDTATLFAGYYLALTCLPACFTEPRLLAGKLWLKLSRLYNDCGDEAMKRYAESNALAAYKAAYEKSRVPAKQMQQLCYIIGELCAAEGDADAARRYFFLAKTEKDGTQVIRRYAEDRLEKLKNAEPKKGQQDAGD
jgi:uncharacterized protein (DUF2225 family)